jgi:hypothetical protein
MRREEQPDKKPRLFAGAMRNPLAGVSLGGAVHHYDDKFLANKGIDF